MHFELETPPKALFDWLPSAICANQSPWKALSGPVPEDVAPSCGDQRDGLLVDHKQKSVSKLQLTFSRLAAAANTARESTIGIITCSHRLEKVTVGGVCDVSILPAETIDSLKGGLKLEFA